MGKQWATGKAEDDSYLALGNVTTSASVNLCLRVRRSERPSPP